MGLETVTPGWKIALPQPRFRKCFTSLQMFEGVCQPLESPFILDWPEFHQNFGGIVLVLFLDRLVQPVQLLIGLVFRFWLVIDLFIGLNIPRKYAVPKKLDHFLLNTYTNLT